VADHGLHATVHQALCRLRAHARVGLIILTLQLEAHLLASNHQPLGIQVINGKLGGILVVLPVMRLGAGHGRGKAELDDGVGQCNAVQQQAGRTQRVQHSLQFVCFISFFLCVGLVAGCGREAVYSSRGHWSSSESALPFCGGGGVQR
jgi:hypothetical protein